MSEYYVTYKVAKLLKEKGFAEFCLYYYQGDNSIRTCSQDRSCYEWNNNHIGEEWYSCPTQQMACRWLREEHEIDISVTPDDGSWWIKITELESWSCVFNGKVLNSDDIKFAYQGSTSIKEECYEAGLWYVLKNLI